MKLSYFWLTPPPPPCALFSLFDPKSYGYLKLLAVFLNLLEEREGVEEVRLSATLSGAAGGDEGAGEEAGEQGFKDFLDPKDFQEPSKTS